MAASQLLNGGGEAIGLHVQILEPLSDHSMQLVESLDTKLEEAERIPCRHVATTIFPDGLWRGATKRGGPERLFDRYNCEGGFYDRLAKRRQATDHHDWGTYFQRLSSPSFGSGGVCQLKAAINALRDWKNKPRGAVHLHTATSADSIRPRGGPCLQIVTLHAQPSGGSHQLCACALYRNHDFFEKALGNYLGLCNLLRFLSDATRMEAGELHIISGHAYFSCSKQTIREVING